MGNNEQGLRRRIGSDHLIGCFSIREDGSYYFTDIRGNEGDIVKNPISSEDDLEIAYSGKKLITGSFYSFLWHLDNDEVSKFVIDGVPQIINNTEFLEGLFNARLSLSGSNLELFNNFQKTIFNEVTGAQHTYIYELLQNANDYPFNNEHVNVKFILTDHYLFFMHSGDYFNLRNVVGISSINQGEKKKNTETIGYKGIGFKTVFVNNEYVYLKSGDWSLRFDKEYSEEKFFGDCPWALMPIPTDTESLDSEISKTLKQNDMRVQFALRHKTDAKKNIAQLDKVFSDNQILLFIPNVYKVDVVIDGSTKHTVEKDDTKWCVTDYRYSVPQDLKAWVEDNINSGDKIPEKFKDIDNVRISFAVGRDGNKLVPVENARVYNYLPTELRLGFSFLFNADFVPNGSRSGLHDVNWNDRIMKQCGSQFADWWVSFLQVENQYDLNTVFDILPQFDNRDKYAQLFIEGFSERIVEIPCIPSLRDGEYHLVKLEDALYDKVGFVACENPVLSDEELYEFSDTTGSLPHPSVRCNENLIRLLKHFNCSISFGDSDLLQLCLEDDFQEWLTQDDHDYTFIGYLLKSGYIMNCWGYKIFLTEDGNIEKADKIYYDIDKFVNDIAFLSNDLPRLNVALRNKLSADYNTWESNKSRFKTFNDFSFVKGIFDNFSNYQTQFSVKENSVRFVHFLAVTGSVVNPPSDFPYYVDGNIMVSDVTDVYQKNDIATELASHPWIEKSWLMFLDEEYFANDEEKVRLYLSSKCNIKTLTAGDCFHNFIAKDSRVTIIAEKIKNKENSIDFFHYLLSIQDVISNITSLMRQNYCILTSDGEDQYWTPITKTIFWNDEEWEAMNENIWMPKGCCLSIDSCYFEGLSDDENTQLRALLSTRQIVQKFSVSGLYQSLRTRLDEVFAVITTKEISKEFLNFLFKHQTELFKNGQIDNIFKKTPILCKDVDELTPIENYGGKVYLPSSDALELFNQPWFNRSAITLCDDYYLDLFDGSERCQFFSNLGLKRFDKIHYLRAHLLIHLDRIKDNLSTRESNIAFHRYIADVHDELSDKDLENVKEMPIFISSPKEDDGILVERSDNHYLPSELLSDIISKDLVPVTILDSIHPDYILSEKDEDYFVDKLKNVVIDEPAFYEYIIQSGVEPKVTPYLKNQERNVKFWRWVCDSKAGKENKAKLNIFPMMFRNEEVAYDVPSNMFISDQYSGVIGLEKFIAENVEAPKFVSSDYIEEGIDRDWTSLFKTLKVTVEYKDIIFKNVLPNLAKYKNTDIVGILAKYADAIKQKLSDKDETMKKYLNSLQLKCNDGIYRTPKDVFVSGKYYEIAVNPFPDIDIPILVSEEYIANCLEDDIQRRNVIKLIVAIADSYDVKIENATQLRNQKLKYYYRHQDYYAQSEAHYRIIGELAKAYNTDRVGVSSLIYDLGPIKLFTTTGKFINSLGQYLSTVYIPECQFMANGITELDFVSEKYDEYCPNGIKPLFEYCLNVFESFTEANLKLLHNEKFARYFWSVYAPNKERSLKEVLTDDKLRGIPCIPTSIGMRKPLEVYDYRNSQLQKIVRKLKDGDSKLPAIELPEWVDRIGMRSRLYILDCLEYLTLDIHDFRRDVIKWFVDTKDETLQRHRSAIEQYIKSANWFSGAKNWVPLNTLVALEWGNETLKGNFGGNAYICNPSYMPESKEDYVKLCKILNIKILTNHDFSKSKAGKYCKDESAIREISKRLLYLAYKTGREDWEKLYASYVEKLNNADVSTCERIIYSYDEHIATDLEIYSEEVSDLWYVGSWQGPMFIKILDWIMKKLEVKGDFDQNFLHKLFLHKFVDFIKQQEGGSLPTELLSYLSDAEKDGISVDENVNAETFTEDAHDVNSLPDEIKQQAEINADQRLEHPIQNEEISDEEEADEAQKEENIEEPTERKRRSDYGGTHQKHESFSSSYEESYPNNSSSNEDEEVTSSEEKKSVTDRLQEKWNKQKNAPVQKPRSSKPVTQESEVFNQTSSSTDSDEEFFDDDVNTSQYTQEKSVKSNSASSAMANERRNREQLNSKQKAAQEELDKANDQADLDYAISRTPKYSFLWFKYLMEQLYNQKNNTAVSRSVQIDFQEAKVLDDYTIAILKPNRVVPKWIEHADSITLHILKGNVTEKIDVDLQYFTDDSIWAYYDGASELEEKINAANKVRLVANGSYANHIDSLTRQFVKLDFEDDFNLRDNLPDCIKYIYGPPGTGKTTRIVSKIQDIVENNDESLDILVLTPTNKAADVIAKRLDENDVCSQYSYRYGVTESLEYLETNEIYTRDDEFMEFDGHHVVVTTAARYAYDYLMPSEEILCDHHWDYVIIDEASMLDIVTMAFILYKSTDCQFIISGDPMQIQPVKQNEIQPENIYQMVGLNSFAAAQSNPQVECLNTQHRSIPSIGRLVSEFSYNGIVKGDRHENDQKPLNLGFNISNINFMGFKTEVFDNLYGLDAIDDSAFHLYSAIFAYEYASYVAKRIKAQAPKEPYSLGIVCPYKKQADSIKQMIELRDISNQSCNVHCGTVHSFQGDQCDVMIVVLNPPANVGPNAHVNNQNIINVAMSRARDYVFFLVPDNRTSGFTSREVLGKIADHDKSILFCKDIEKVMFGQEDYIQQHTNVTCHMPVNVYYEPTALYEVRKDDKAVDIQINEQFR
jgi:hypothetical protein